MKSKQELKFEIKVSICLLVISIVYVIMTRTGIDISGRFFSGSGNLNPTTFPYFVSAIFTATALYLLVKSILQYNRALKDETTAREQGIEIPAEEKKAFDFPVKEAIQVLAAFAVYIALLRQIGFLLDTILLSLGTLFYLNRKNWIRNVIYSIVFPVFVFALFYYVLRIRVPIGILFGGR